MSRIPALPDRAGHAPGALPRGSPPRVPIPAGPIALRARPRGGEPGPRSDEGAGPPSIRGSWSWARITTSTGAPWPCPGNPLEAALHYRRASVYATDPGAAGSGAPAGGRDGIRHRVPLRGEDELPDFPEDASRSPPRPARSGSCWAAACPRSAGTMMRSASSTWRGLRGSAVREGERPAEDGDDDRGRAGVRGRAGRSTGNSPSATTRPAAGWARTSACRGSPPGPRISCCG